MATSGFLKQEYPLPIGKINGIEYKLTASGYIPTYQMWSTTFQKKENGQTIKPSHKIAGIINIYPDDINYNVKYDTNEKYKADFPNATPEEKKAFREKNKSVIDAFEFTVFNKAPDNESKEISDRCFSDLKDFDENVAAPLCKEQYFAKVKGGVVMKSHYVKEGTDGKPDSARIRLTCFAPKENKKASKLDYIMKDNIDVKLNGTSKMEAYDYVVTKKEEYKMTTETKDNITIETYEKKLSSGIVTTIILERDNEKKTCKKTVNRLYKLKDWTRRAIGNFLKENPGTYYCAGTIVNGLKFAINPKLPDTSSSKTATCFEPNIEPTLTLVKIPRMESFGYNRDEAAREASEMVSKVATYEAVDIDENTIQEYNIYPEENHNEAEQEGTQEGSQEETKEPVVDGDDI